MVFNPKTIPNEMQPLVIISTGPVLLRAVPARKRNESSMDLKAAVTKYDPVQALTKEQITELGKDLGIKSWKSYDSDW